MSEPSTAAQSNDWFSPTWSRFLFATALAMGGFLLPQEVPLEWYPLNNPGTDLNYLEIACAANMTGVVQIAYDLARRGHQPVDTIRWPISPTTQTFTYAFPLPDAPITEMRVLPPVGGELIIRQMRIINRRNEEIRRFTSELFRTERDSATIVPVPEGWKLVAAPGAALPSTRIELFAPIIPAGKDHRNLLRCLLSTGYLTLMLWILLLAGLFVFYRPKAWRDLMRHLGFMAGLAVLFAFVGNRGLIRNAVDNARYTFPPVGPGLKLELDLTSSAPSVAQLFWDTGNGFNETDGLRQNYAPHQGLQTLRFPLPAKPVQGLRFDPRDNPGAVEIRGIRLVDAGQRTVAVLPFDSLRADRDIAKFEARPDSLGIQTIPDSKDAITQFSAQAIEVVNRAVANQAGH